MKRARVSRIAAAGLLLQALAGGVCAEIPFNHVEIDAAHVGHRAVSDIDGDGTNDIAGVNFMTGDDQVVWYRCPDWTRFVVVEVNTYPDFSIYRSDDMVTADIDDDGDDDIVGRVGPSDDGNGIVVWWENPRPGASATNRPWVRHDIGNTDYNKDLDAVDFDLDGDLDIAARENAETHVFRQNNPTSWTRVAQVSHYDHEGMAVGDLDGDGDEDIVLNGFWLRNPHPADLTNTWAEHSIDSKWYTQTGHGWQDNNCNVHAADLNGDTNVDVLISQSEMPGYPLSWYEAADPVNGPWTEHQIMAVFDYCQTLETGDIDRDGHPDVLAAEFPRYDAPYPVLVFLNNGDATTWTTQQLADTGIYHGHLGDVGSDGDLDIVAVRNYDTAPIEMWENQLSDLVLALTNWTYIQVDNSRAKWGDWDTPDWSRYFGLAMGDLTGDGYKDIVSGRYFYRNPGGAMTSAWPRVDLGLNCDANLIVNVDDDALGDAIASAGDKVYWLEANDTTGSAWTATVIDPSFPKPDHGNPQGYRTAQIVPGGKPEVLLNGTCVYMYQIPVSPGAGNWPRTSIVLDSNGEDIGLGDIDGDGYIDVAVGHHPPGWTVGDPRYIKWAVNPGDGSSNWTEHLIGTIDGNYPDRLSVADLNGDNRPDIVVTEEEQPVEPLWKTYWFEAPADPTQSNWVRHVVVTQYTSNAMDVEDMDNDGDIDLVIGEHRGSKKLAIWENNGAGGFTQHVVDTNKESHLGARVSDLDGDGDLDILSICWDDYQYLHLWRNNNGDEGGYIPTNQPPVVSAGSDEVIVHPTSNLLLNGSVSDDGKPAGGTLTMLWTRESGPGSVAFDTPTAEDTWATFSQPGTYVVRLTADDGELNAYAEATVSYLETNADIVLYWPLDDGAGPTAEDVGPYGNDGTLQNASWATGYLAGALSCNGTDAYATRGHGSLQGPFPAADAAAQDFSVCAWVFLDSGAHRNPICGKQGNEQRGFMFMVESDDTLALEIFKATGSAGTHISSSATLDTGVWYHVAATYKYIADGSSRVRLYINAASDGSSDTAEGPPALNTTSFDAGRYYWSGAYSVYCDGLIDHLQVYARELSQPEIAMIMDGDADFDGLPDLWELDKLDGIGESGSSDTDGDGEPNSREHTADTDPDDIDDYFILHGITRASPPEILFDSSTARVYALHYIDDLTSGSWSNVPGATNHTGTGLGDTLSDTNQLPPGRAYRVGVRLP